MIAYWERDKEWMGDGLVGAWCPSFTQSTGLSLLDVSGYANHGVLTNMDPGTDWVSSGNAVALDFDGSNDYINARTPTIELSTSGCTLSLWYINSSGTSGVYAALCSSTGATQFLVFQASGSAINLVHRNNAGGDSATSGGTWQSATWKNIIAVSSLSGLTLYSNGIQTSSLARTPGATTFNQISIGALNRAGSLSNYSVSRQDDIRIYNRALAAAEINQLYVGGRGAGMLYEPPRRRSFQGVTLPRPDTYPIRRKPRKSNNLLNGLVGAWCPSLGATGTQLRDVSGRNNHGSMVNMTSVTSWSPDGNKGSLTFNGTSTYLTTPSIPLGTVHSFSCWFYQGTIPSTYNVNALFGESGSVNTCPIMLDTSNISYSMLSSGASVARTYETGKWTHLISVRNGATVDFYSDGRYLGASAVPNSAITFTLGRIGARQLISGLYANGKLDDIRVYNRALTPAEVRQLYTGGRGYGLTQRKSTRVGFTDSQPNSSKIAVRKPKKKNTLTTGLVGAWCPSLGATGTRLLDRSPYRNHGTLTNMDPGTDWVTSGGKGALDFDGSNDYSLASVNLSQAISRKIYSVSIWMRTSATNSNAYQFSLGNSASDSSIVGFRIDPGGNGSLIVLLRDDANNTSLPGAISGSICNGDWNNCIVTVNGTTAIVYVNGLQYGSTASVTSLGTTTINRATVGALGRTAFASYYSGLADDIRIYNRALTASEINQLYVGGRGYGLQPTKRTTSKKTIYVDTPVPAKPKPTVDTAQKLKQGLVGAWIPSLGATGTRLEDKSPYKNHGTLTNMDPGTDWVNSGGAGALDFDNTNDRVDLGVITAINTGEISFSFWYFPFTVSGLNTIFNNWSATVINAGFFCYRTGANIVFQAPTSAERITTTIGNIQANSWNHIVCVRRNGVGGLRVVINGVLDGNSATAGSPQASTAQFNFCGNYGGAGAGNCQLDDFRIYNRALTPQEIKALYQGGRGYGFRPQRTRYVLGTETINTGGFKGSWYRRRPLLIGSGIQ